MLRMPCKVDDSFILWSFFERKHRFLKRSCKVRVCNSNFGVDHTSFAESLVYNVMKQTVRGADSSYSNL